VKNPIPDASTARRWNLLSEASSSAVIKSLEPVSVTAPPAAEAACRTADCICPIRHKNIRRKQRATDLEMNGKETHDCWQANYIAGCPPVTW
jgi:hypothetical protein